MTYNRPNKTAEGFMKHEERRKAQGRTRILNTRHPDYNPKTEVLLRLMVYGTTDPICKGYRFYIKPVQTPHPTDFGYFIEKLLSFHNSQEIKDKYVSRVKLHAAADEIIKGTYWEHGKGCAVGCTVHSSSHKAYETEMGIPEALARYEDFIFERLPNGQAKTFPLEFIEAIPVGVDLLPVAFKFSLWIIEDEKVGLIHKVTDVKAKEFLEKLADILKKEISGEITVSEREKFRKYAYAYANAYAYAYAYAYANANANAYAYAYAYAYANAYANAPALRIKLIELLKEAQ